MSSRVSRLVFWGFMGTVAMLLPGYPSLAAEPPAPSGTQTITGEIVIVTDDFYLVKDAAGKSVQLRLSKVFEGPKDTKVDGVLKAGDKIEAQVEPDGHALSIKKAR